jgi:hypothetical protein
LYFIISIVEPSADRRIRKRLAASYRRLVADAASLRPHGSTIALTVSRRTGMDVYSFHDLNVQRL